MTTTVVVAAPAYGEHPIAMQCPSCQANITTSLTYSTGGLTWLVAGGICLLGFWLGCCLIPFCIDSLKDVEHSCPNCKRMLGKKSRL